MNPTSKMADIFAFQMLRKFIFGNGAIQKIGEEAANTFEGRRVLMVTDKGIIAAGLMEEAKIALENSGFAITVFDEVVPDPPISVVQKGVAVARNEAADIIFGIGGGSPMDAAKAISVMVPYEGDIHDYLGLNCVKKPGLPKMLVPTTAGTGSEMSAGCILTDDKSGKKVTSFSPYFLSDLSIIDPVLTLSLPPKVTAETGMDAFSHAMEAFGCIQANPLSDMFALRAIEYVAQNIRKAYAYCNGRHNLDARYGMCVAASFGVLAMRASAGGMIHATCYPPAVKYHLSHGCAISIMMPYVMEYNLLSVPEKYAAVAEAMGERVEHLSTKDAARVAVRTVRNLTAELNLPTTLQEVGVTQADLPEFAKQAMTYSRNVLSNPRNVTEQDVTRIYESAWEGRLASI